MSDVFCCKLCDEDFVNNDPRILPCSHSFCRECLEKVAAKNALKIGDRFLCWSCDRRLEWPRFGASGFPKNVYVKTSEAKKITKNSKDSITYDLELIDKEEEEMFDEINKYEKELIEQVKKTINKLKLDAKEIFRQKREKQTRCAEANTSAILTSCENSCKRLIVSEKAVLQKDVKLNSKVVKIKSEICSQSDIKFADGIKMDCQVLDIHATDNYIVLLLHSNNLRIYSKDGQHYSNSKVTLLKKMTRDTWSDFTLEKNDLIGIANGESKKLLMFTRHQLFKQNEQDIEKDIILAPIFSSKDLTSVYILNNSVFVVSFDHIYKMDFDGFICWKKQFCNKIYFPINQNKLFVMDQNGLHLLLVNCVSNLERVKNRELQNYFYYITKSFLLFIDKFVVVCQKLRCILLFIFIEDNCCRLMKRIDLLFEPICVCVDVSRKGLYVTEKSGDNCIINFISLKLTL